MAPKIEKGAVRLLGVIEVETGAGGALIQRVLDWDLEVSCKEGNPSSCPDYFIAKQRLEEILKDGVVNAVETPRLFKILLKMAGEDKILTLDELKQKPLREYLLERRIDLEQAVKEQNRVLDHLKKVEQTTENTIQIFEKRKSELEAEAISFWNFASAENWLGLSALFTHDGSTFSDGELQGVRRLLHTLRDYQEGVRLFRQQLASGEINIFQSDVDRFLKSPLAAMAHLKFYLGGEYFGKNEASNVEEAADVGAWLAGLAYQQGAIQSAYTFANESAKELGEGYEYKLKQNLEDGFFEFYDTRFVPFGNAVASLDSIGLSTVGAGAGRLLGGDRQNGRQFF